MRLRKFVPHYCPETSRQVSERSYDPMTYTDMGHSIGPTYVGVWVQKYRRDWRYCRYKLLHVETCDNTSGQIDFTWMIFRVYGLSLIFWYSLYPQSIKIFAKCSMSLAAVSINNSTPATLKIPLYTQGQLVKKRIKMDNVNVKNIKYRCTKEKISLQYSIL